MAENLGKSLMDTISMSDLPDALRDFGEECIDQFLEEGIVKEIPILKSVGAISKSVGAIKDYLFMKKLVIFLFSMNEMSEEDKRSLMDRLNKDAKSAAYVGEMLIELLSRLDNADKSLMIAKALKAYASGYFDFIQLQRINYAIDRLLMCDLQQLRSFVTATETVTTNGRPEILNFINSGLAYIKSGYGSGGVHDTEVGRLFVKYIL